MEREPVEVSKVKCSIRSEVEAFCVGLQWGGGAVGEPPEGRSTPFWSSIEFDGQPPWWRFDGLPPLQSTDHRNNNYINNDNNNNDSSSSSSSSSSSNRVECRFFFFVCSIDGPPLGLWTSFSFFAFDGCFLLFFFLNTSSQWRPVYQVYRVVPSFCNQQFGNNGPDFNDFLRDSFRIGSTISKGRNRITIRWLISFSSFFFGDTFLFFSFLFPFFPVPFSVGRTTSSDSKKKIIRFHCMLIFSNYFLKKTFGTARGFGTGKSIGPRYATPTILIFWPKIDEFWVFRCLFLVWNEWKWLVLFPTFAFALLWCSSLISSVFCNDIFATTWIMKKSIKLLPFLGL